MLGYDWTTHSPPSPPPHPNHPPQLILPDDLHHHHHHHPSPHAHHRQMFEDPFASPCAFPHHNAPPDHHGFNHLDAHAAPHFASMYDPTSSSFAPSSSFNPLQPPGGHHMLQPEYSILVPKPDPEFANRIGLNLGGRTYFASDDDLVSRLYRRTRGGDQLVNAPKCQAEGCNADLTHAKHYHRRHKVCEFHSKASTVVAAGLTQRFCQQCSSTINTNNSSSSIPSFSPQQPSLTPTILPLPLHHSHPNNLLLPLPLHFPFPSPPLLHLLPFRLSLLVGPIPLFLRDIHGAHIGHPIQDRCGVSSTEAAGSREGEWKVVGEVCGGVEEERFHLLSEFDNGKRSCRKRLADHNRRRRKSHQAPNRDQLDSDPHLPPKSLSQSIQRSTSDSGANSTSSVTVAISSPLASFDSTLRQQRSYD